MTQKQFFLNLFGLVIILALINYGGPLLSKKAFESYKNSVDKNGVFLKALVSGKRQHKGHLVSFTYTYRGKEYSNEEQDADYYDELAIGDAIQVVVDTTDPDKSYIFATN